MADSRTVTGDDDMGAEGTPFRRIRMDEDLWQRLHEACKRADPDSNRSMIIRRFARWYVGDISEVPQRPEPKAPQALSAPSSTVSSSPIARRYASSSSRASSSSLMASQVSTAAP